MQDGRDEPTVEEMERMKAIQDQMMRERESVPQTGEMGIMAKMVVVDPKTHQRIKPWPRRVEGKRYDVVGKRGKVWLLLGRLKDAGPNKREFAGDVEGMLKLAAGLGVDVMVVDCWTRKVVAGTIVGHNDG